MYMFNNAQNQLLSFMADELLAHIVHNIKTSHYFGIWANEVADVIKWEQLGLSVQYIKDGQSIEQNIAFLECKATTGEAICSTI